CHRQWSMSLGDDPSLRRRSMASNSWTSRSRIRSRMTPLRVSNRAAAVRREEWKWPPGPPVAGGRMPEYLIFFNQQWVPDYPEEDFVEIGVESKALVAEMKDAGVLVFAGGLEETPALASADATSGELVITDGPYAETKECVGGLTIVDVADDEAA